MMRILIVDDETKIREVVSEYSKAMGYECDQACNGKDAIEHSILKYISGFSKDALTYVSEKINGSSLTQEGGFNIESYREEFQKWLESF